MKPNSRWTPPVLMYITWSTQRGREGWSAVYEVKGKRVIGRLLTAESRHRPLRNFIPREIVLPEDMRVVRDHFDVALKKDGTFAVDIGTGSGVKIRFSHKEAKR